LFLKISGIINPSTIYELSSLNSETLWLQIPAAKTPSIKQMAISSAADKLKYIAHTLAALQDNSIPYVGKPSIIFFVAEQGISLESKIDLVPSPLTELINIFSIEKKVQSIKKKTIQAKIEVINLSNTETLNSITGIINSNIARCTANFSHTAAMNEQQLAKAINIGRQSAQRIKLKGEQVFIASEINNTNTFSAIAIICALFNMSPEQLNERDSEKNKLIHLALNKHKDQLTAPLDILRCLGSFEIAALTGSYLCCAHMGIPILINGIASAVAALITTKICHQAGRWFIYSQSSNNTTHAFILKTLKAKPLLQDTIIDTRLDNFSAIITALTLLQCACNQQSEGTSVTEEKLLQRYSYI